MADEQETDDAGIDAVLDKALANYSDAPAPAGEVDKPTETPSEAATAPREDGRDEKGRFAPKTPKPEEGGDVLAAADPKADETAAPETAKPATPAWTDGHFTGWKPEERERFAALPPEVQQFLMDRQAASQAFYSRKLNEESDYRKQTEPLYKAAREIEPFARSIGQTPDALMRNYAAVDYNLRYAPYAEKVKLLGEIARSYGIPFAPPEPDPLADPLQPNGQAYPVIHDLQSQVAGLKAQLDQYKRQAETQSSETINQTIASFSTATNADGSPKYPFFDVVKPAMGQLIAQGKAATLEEAYTLATKPLEERLSARQKAAQEEQAKILARAKKSAPVRVSGAAPNGKTKGTSLDSILNESLSAHGM